MTKTETIHHEAVYEETQPEWDEKLYVTHWICNQCGADITGHIDEHLKTNDDCWGYHSTEVWEGGYIHHEGEKVLVKPAWDETKEVVVKPAWDEKVSEGFYCTECGKKKD